MATPVLVLAANGHLFLTFEGLDAALWQSACSWLARHNFLQTGKAIVGLDETICPSFVRGVTKIAAGHDNWSGSYLLAECSHGDTVLLDLARHIGADDRRSLA